MSPPPAPDALWELGRALVTVAAVIALTAAAVLGLLVLLYR